MDLLYKTVQAQLKALDDKGQGQAVIATLNVIDHDEDVTEMGAFGEQWVKMVPTHNWSHAPIGKARLHEAGNEVIADFQMNLAMESGKEWYEALKFDLKGDFGPPLQEWSYGFRILDSGFGEFEERQVRFLKRVKAIEVSPVMIGAGMNTRTTALKSADTSGGPMVRIPTHTTDTSSAPWDTIVQEKRIPTASSVAYYQRVYGYHVMSDDPTVKASWRFPHHEISDDGTPGAANLRACHYAIAVLNKGRSGPSVPDEDRQAVYDHLAGHLKDGGEDPPTLGSLDDMGIPFDVDLNLMQWDLEGLIERGKDLKLIRALKGKDLSELRLQQFGVLKRLLETLELRIRGVQSLGPDAVADLKARFDALRKAI